MTVERTTPSDTLPYRKSDFSFELPERLIAQAPAASRGGSRLLVLNGADGSVDFPNMLHIGIRRGSFRTTKSKARVFCAPCRLQ